MDSLSTLAIRYLKEYVDNVHHGVVSRAAKALGISNPTLVQWLNGKRTPNLEALDPVFLQLGITFSKDLASSSKKCVFVSPQIPAANLTQTQSLSAETFLAVPVVGEIGACSGFLLQNQIKSWFLLDKNLPAVRFRKNLIAVEVASMSAMSPTLNPGDIALVDKDDRDVQAAGHIMLVLTPDRRASIRRVSVEEQKNDYRIVLYSDNAAKWPPSLFSLKKDYDNSWDNLLIGRVVWAWCDVREK